MPLDFPKGGEFFILDEIIEFVGRIILAICLVFLLLPVTWVVASLYYYFSGDSQGAVRIQREKRLPVCVEAMAKYGLIFAPMVRG